MTDANGWPDEAREAVRLDECPPGLFLFNGMLGFRSEYTTTLENPRRYQPDAYVVESGEYFWGGTADSAERSALMVMPVEPITPPEHAAALAALLAAERAAGVREGMEKAVGMVRVHAAAAKKCSEETDVIHIIRADFLGRSFALTTAADDITAAMKDQPA